MQIVNICPASWRAGNSPAASNRRPASHRSWLAGWLEKQIGRRRSASGGGELSTALCFVLLCRYSTDTAESGGSSLLASSRDHFQSAVQKAKSRATTTTTAISFIEPKQMEDKIAAADSGETVCLCLCALAATQIDTFLAPSPPSSSSRAIKHGGALYFFAGY